MSLIKLLFSEWLLGQLRHHFPLLQIKSGRNIARLYCVVMSVSFATLRYSFLH